MENANEAGAPPLSMPSVDSQPPEAGGRIPRREGDAGGGSTSSVTDSSTHSSLPSIRGDEDEICVVSLASDRSTAANTPTTNNNTVASTAVEEHAAPTQNSIGKIKPEAVRSDRAGNGSGEQGLRDLNSTTRGSIPNIPVVFATQEGQESKSGKPSPGVRFGWAHRAVNEETKAQAGRKFWAGVKPARVNSMLVVPARSGPPGLSMVTLRAAMKLKRKANVIQAKSVLSKNILDPRSLRVQYWKNWMLVNIMFTVLVTPWRISFQVPARAFGLVLAGIVNISFIADTVLHFFTAVETESALLTDRKEIARRYIRSWFLIDLLSCVPYNTLLRNVIPPSLMIMGPVRALRLLKLLKVVKVYTMHYEVSPVAMSIGKTLVTVILAAHLLSCFWFWVHCYDALQQGTPKAWDQCGRPTSVASQYLSSFYFIIYTMMTVGYGDQHADPLSRKSLILSVCIQLTGATLFGFIIAATRRIVQFIAPIQKVTTTNLQKISEYALDRRLPDGVSSRIKRHFRYFYFKTSVFDERAVMEHVPWQLCQEVMSTTHGVAISATGLLQDQGFSPIALMRLARAMKPMELDSREEAILQGDMVLQAYFVIKGRIEAYIHEDHACGRASWVGGDLDGPPLRQASYLGVWGPGSLWGLNNIMLGGFSEATFVAASPSDLLWLDQSDLIAAMDEHSEMRACLEKTATADRNSLREAVDSATITKEGLKLKQISLTDFKASDLKQQLKHTDIRSLCMAASADQVAAAAATQSGAGSAGGVVGMVQDFQQMAAFGGRGVRGRLKSIVGSVRGALGAGQRSQMRLVRTWRGGSYGFGDVLDGMGKVVKGVTETEETPEELNHRLIMLPDQPVKLRWDVAISMVCVLVAILSPYRMAFAHIDARSWLVFDAVVDVLFVFDILLRFRTAYVGNAANNVIVYITVPGMIAKNYLRGWMLFDMASTVPSYLFGTPDKVFRALVVLKLLRIGRVPALAQQLHRLREQQAMTNSGRRRRSLLQGIHIEVPRWCLDVVQILVVILYASHIFGCVWWVTSRYDADESWWEIDGLKLDDATSTYIASLYWAATTITTVGYGDLVPTNDIERMVACLTMVCGTTMFSYVIGSVSTLVMNPTGGNVRRNMEMMNVENYLEEQRVGAHLSNSVRTHMVFVTGARSAWNEDYILSRLPPRLQERVLEHVHRDAVLTIPILKTRPPSFVAAILRNLRPRQFSQGEVVYKNLQMSQGVYFVTKGIAEAYARANDGSGGVEEEKVKGIVSAGKLFGYSRFLAAFLEEDMAVKAFTPLYVYLLSNSSIRHLLQYHPFLAEDLRVGLEEAVFLQASEEISSDKKRQAARLALYGSKSEESLAGTSGKPPRNPNHQRRGTEQPERRTSAPTTYRRKESASALRTSADYHQHLEGRGGGAGEEARIAPPSAGSGRKRRASGTVGEGEEEEKRAGQDAARRLGYHGRDGEKRNPQEVLSARIEVADSSEEESMTLPGLSGVLMTQLTWGADAWDAARAEAKAKAEAEAEAEAEAVNRDKATAGTGSHGDQQGLVGTTKPPALAVFGDLDQATDGTAGPGVAESWGDTAAADALEGGREEGASGHEASSSRRMTFTERLEPLRHSASLSDALPPSLEQDDEPRHIPPKANPPQGQDQDRDTPGEEWKTPTSHDHGPGDGGDGGDLARR